MRPAPRATKKAPPFFDVHWDVADAAALQAVMNGTADEIQQKRAVGWIINHAARTYDVTFQPDSDRTTAFAEGRRFVGLKIRELLSVSTRDLAAKAAPK